MNKNHIRPELVAQWHPTLNGALLPQDVAPYSRKQIWWVCPRGHEWRERAQGRSKGTECPECTGRTSAPLAPTLAAQWHPSRNGSLTADQVTAGSGKNVWWLCSSGHEWSARISNRTAGAGCPTCGGKKTLPLPAEIVAGWHPTRNGTLTPDQFTTGSNKAVWWMCPTGHEWEAKISNRVAHGCQKCAGYARRGIAKPRRPYRTQVPLPPKLAAQWHPTLNGDLTADQVTAGSGRRVWWLCPNGHAFQTVVSGRAGGSGCKQCPRLTGQPLTAELVAQWHPDLNGPLKPELVTAGSHRVVWWQCAERHVWSAVIYSRAKGSGCPDCATRGRLAAA